MKRKKTTVRVRRVVGEYPALLTGIKERIRAAQVRATLAANAELIWLYWEVGRMIAEQQEKRGWGAQVIPGLARDIANQLPEVKGFGERNLKQMIRFYREYGQLPIVQQAAAQLGQRAAREKATNEIILPQAVAKLESAITNKRFRVSNM